MVRKLTALFVFFTLGLGAAQNAEPSAADFIEDGQTALEREACQVALYHFEEALKLEQTSTGAALGKGKALVCQRSYATGIETLQNVISAEPENLDAYITLADAHVKQYESDPERFAGDLDEALSAVEQGERVDSSNPELLNVKGVALYRLSETTDSAESLTEAQAALEQAATLAGSLATRDQALININLGKTYLLLGDNEKALQAFKRATSLNPSSASAHNNVGAAYFALGNCDDAIYELNQAVNLNPASVDAAFNLGRAYFDCDQLDAAVPRFESAIELSDALSVPLLYTYLSRAYVQQNRPDEAVMRAQQGALLPPASAEALYYLGQAYEARGQGSDLDDARKAYESALELDPEFGEAQTALDALQ